MRETTIIQEQEYFNGTKTYTKSMCFMTEAEAEFADAVALRAEQNGIGVNEFMHMYPLILRMLKDKSEWAS